MKPFSKADIVRLEHPKGASHILIRKVVKLWDRKYHCLRQIGGQFNLMCAEGELRVHVPDACRIIERLQLNADIHERHTKTIYWT